MALNIFQQYGIKEVMNVYFEALEADEKSGVEAGDIVLYLDTLKVSTYEQTAEQVEARGGWGNPALIIWDYNKDITITLEDALISMESLRLMLGGAIKQASSTESVTLNLTEEGTVETAGTVPTLKDHMTDEVLDAPTTYKFINLTTGVRGTEADFSTKAAAGDTVRFFWSVEKDGTDGDAIEITISPNTFPGTYKIVGDTFIRDTNGKDSAYQMVIFKGKVNSEVTITMQAEGDPSTFSMTIRCLRDGDKIAAFYKY